jgi:2-keto-4-pentenoate hydratase
VTLEASDTDLIARCAAELHRAESTRRPTAPLTRRFPRLTVPEAYRIQQVNVERRVAQGERIVGHKIGLTAKAMQELFGVSEPDYGHLLDTMMHDERTPLDLGTLIDPQIEIEPAFVLGRPLQGPHVGIEDVLAATDHIRVCFEVIDSRIIDWQVRLQDTVADNGSSARVVLGALQVDPADLELDDLETELELDGVVVETGNTSAILGHPANGIAWLANRISAFGLVLDAGHVVLPGTCTRCVRIGGHTRVAGRIDGLGEVTLQLIGAPFVPNKQRTNGS